MILSLVSAGLCLPPQYPEEPPAKPQPYSYHYGVKDDYSKANFAKQETQDADGRVTGTIIIALPDGRIQTTKYSADAVNGYVAEVSYKGEPVFPDQSKDAPVYTDFTDKPVIR